MALTTRRAQELADLLPEGMRCDDSRERLLCLVELLRALTDKDHALSNADIRAVLRAKFGPSCAPSENTIAADLRAIGRAGCLGIRLHTGPTGTWAERTDFDFGEVRLLLNAVQSSRMLTVAQSNDLAEDIFGLVSRRQEDDLIDEVIVADRKSRRSQRVLDVLDLAARARRTKRLLEFRYTYTRFDGKMRTVFLRVRSDMTNVFFDRFGQGAKFFLPVGVDGDPSSTRLTVMAVPETLTFFRWLSAEGAGIVMEPPPAEFDLSIMRSKVGKCLAGKSREDLEEDYEVMLKRYLSYLDAARAPYLS